MSAPRRTAGLGRGIGALMNLPEEGERHLEAVRPSDVYFGRPAGGDDDLMSVPGLKLAAIAPDDIRANPQQPRRHFDPEAQQELEDSIRENGVLQPIVVRPLGAGQEVGFELVMGERRLRAARSAGLKTIPAVVKDTSDDLMLQEALLENLHRLQLNAMEEASAFQQLVEDFGISHEELAIRLGMSRSGVTNSIRLLNLPEAVQRKVASGVISARHGRAVLAVVDPEQQEKLVDRVIVEELNVRQTEAAAALLAGPARRKKAQRRDEKLEEIADRLGSRFDTRVKVHMTARSGRITIDFGSVADLNRILGEMGEQRWEEGESRERLLATRTAALKRAR
ncbi:ParB/RepB/Spo0J family partition protein [Amnibacterium endophyticum]|uniref:ParB/RepB/Spo0J family partition protein n=1 Tax=Amnibacterium endophyticum TaxID=2109337 RepID=A0ABW4LCP7_9MICO